MSRIPGRYGWVAPLLVGASAAVAAEVALGTLLYGGSGLMRSLTAVLAVEGGAFAVGLWSAPAPGPRLVDRLRRRWLLCLTAFMLASIFSTSWSVIQDLGSGRIGQALGLTFLAALPLYACGAVIGGMGSVRVSDPAGARRGPGASVALGAGIGFVLTGMLLPRAPIPASLLVACLVLLSAGGMVYGAVLGARLQVQLRAERSSASGVVRVEDRRSGEAGPPIRYLLEGEHVRRRVSLNGDTPLPWDVAVARAMLGAQEGPSRVLAIGGGASALPHAILDEHPLVTIDVLERSDAVIELARGHLGTEAEGADGRLTVRVGNLEDLLSEVQGSYDLVLVDTAALAPTGGVSGLSRAARAALHEAVGGRGVLASGPLPPEPVLGEPAEAWRRWVLRRRHDESEDVLVLALRVDSGVEPPAIDDFEPADGATPTR